VNTIENEGSLVVAADGKTAYYASDRSEGYGGLDLYTFELRKEIRPTRTLWVKGRVTDKRTMNGLPATVELAEIKTKSILNRIPTDEEGYYLITLPVGKDYAFNVNRKGYLFYSENFSLQDKAADSTYTINIPLQPLEANALVVLRNIFFDTNAFELKAESFSELEKILQVLQENPSIKVEISGHTDNTGNAEENSKLSILRANAVVRYLIDKGISRERLVAKGYGDTQPIATNNTSEGRAQNRRTQLIILSR
jgi:outer membrane protein OmpA-like peptidoglycan-associated protein